MNWPAFVGVVVTWALCQQTFGVSRSIKRNTLNDLREVHGAPRQRERRAALILSVAVGLNTLSTATIELGWWTLAAVPTAILAGVPIGLLCAAALLFSIRAALWFTALSALVMMFATIGLAAGPQGVSNILRYFGLD